MKNYSLYYLFSLLAIGASDELCDYRHPRKGYATSCQNECFRPNPNRISTVKDNTPCLKLNKIKTKPKDDAGLCKNGVCVPYYDLEGKDPQVVEKVFPRWLHLCPSKHHASRPPVKSCYYYCRRNWRWYYGFYKKFTRCVGASRRPVGFCCYGKCYTRKEFCEK